ncbi:MAG: hypothetical protein GTN76_16125 [Candidatus Aenigmarchaeota archaeon]|nr:hypothetical protein [Candidatus Aenigmarchaeota archaeon]
MNKAKAMGAGELYKGGVDWRKIKKYGLPVVIIGGGSTALFFTVKSLLSDYRDAGEEAMKNLSPKAAIIETTDDMQERGVGASKYKKKGAKDDEITPMGLVTPNQVNKNVLGKYTYDLTDGLGIMMAYYEAIHNGDKNLYKYLLSDETIRKFKEKYNMGPDEAIGYILEGSPLTKKKFNYVIGHLYKENLNGRWVLRWEAQITIFDEDGNIEGGLVDRRSATKTEKGEWKL